MEESVGNTGLIIQFLTLVIGAPVSEELIYRNMALTNMNKRLSPIISITISSAIFGVVHGSLLQMIYAAALGFLFGVLFVRTESIFPSLLAHAVFNAMGFGMPLLADYLQKKFSAEVIFNHIIGAITILSLILAPLMIICFFKNTDRPLRVKHPRVKREPPAAQVPHIPPNLQYGYPPYPYYNQPPYAPMPPTGWVFDQRYGWIYVGQPQGKTGVDGGNQNPIDISPPPEQSDVAVTDEIEKTEE